MSGRVGGGEIEKKVIKINLNGEKKGFLLRRFFFSLSETFSLVFVLFSRARRTVSGKFIVPPLLTFV